MTLRLLVPPPLVALASGGLIKITSLVWPASRVSIPAGDYIAMGIALVAALFALWGVVAIGRARTTISPHHPDRSTQLVVSGAFRYSRNPIYLGLLLLVIAFGLRKGQPLGTLLAVTSFVLYMNRFQIVPEEEALERRCPREFALYRSRVRRWF